jgi:hypothetical protein
MAWNAHAACSRSLKGTRGACRFSVCQKDGMERLCRSFDDCGREDIGDQIDGMQKLRIKFKLLSCLPKVSSSAMQVEQGATQFRHDRRWAYPLPFTSSSP